MNIQGFNFEVDILQVILWQYNNATNLVSLLNDKQSWLQSYQTEFWYNPGTTSAEGWYQNVFDLLTANTFGLAVWAILLNVPSYLPAASLPPNSQIWGFNAFTDDTHTALENSYLNFGITSSTQSNFSNINQTLSLTDEQQRFLLRLRYYQLITRGQIYSSQANLSVNPTPYDINAFLNYLCETSNIGYPGSIYILDKLDMSITYVFTAGGFPAGLLQAITQLDIWPRPAGVLLNEFEIIIGGEFYFLNETPFYLLNGNPLYLL